MSGAHVTVWRWVQRYAPELERRLRRRLKPTNGSWRVDETYIRVKGKWVYLYRAVDSTGATIDFLLSAKRDEAAAERFLASNPYLPARVAAWNRACDLKQGTLPTHADVQREVNRII